MRDDDQWTLKALHLASRAHIHGARRVLEGASAGENAPALTPASAAYIAHVALECAMKARILHRSGCNSVKDLKRKSPKTHEKLFRGRHGHNLEKLSKDVRLQGFLKTNGKNLSVDSCWKRMTQDDRPYTLRYGAECIDAPLAGEDVARAKELADALLDGIRYPKRKKLHGP